jgi:hypothetical protein
MATSLPSLNALRLSVKKVKALPLETFCRTENIEWLIEGQSFSQSFDLVPRHPLPSPVNNLDRRLTERLRKRDNLLTGEGAKGVGEEPSHTTARRLGSSVNNSILSDLEESVVALSTNLETLKEPRNRFQGTNSARLGIDSWAP